MAEFNLLETAEVFEGEGLTKKRSLAKSPVL